MLIIAVVRIGLVLRNGIDPVIVVFKLAIYFCYVFPKLLSLLWCMTAHVLIG